MTEIPKRMRKCAAEKRQPLSGTQAAAEPLAGAQAVAQALFKIVLKQKVTEDLQRIKLPFRLVWMIFPNVISLGIRKPEFLPHS